VVAAAVVVYGALIVRDFYRYVDRAVYLAYDDSLANTAYALATTGHYGFPASPYLAGFSRSDGLINYGPWYFWLGAVLIGLFGYSLTLLRSIHLWAIVAIAATAPWWFHAKRTRGPEWAIAGAGMLWFLDVAQWPMVRPDVFVSVFAVIFVAAAGTAIRSRRAVWWGVAGAAAACGAVTHLIAWSLVPAAALVWCVAMIALPDARQHWGGGFVALVLGGLAAAFVFYASFDFRVRDQIAFLSVYRSAVADYQGPHAGVAGYVSLVRNHYSIAYGLLPFVGRLGVAAVAVAAWSVMASALRSGAPAEERVRTLALVLPPVAAWSLYLLSLGWYPNQHSGYAILNQVLAPWTAAAVVAVALDRLSPASRTRARYAVAAVVGVTAVVLGWSKITDPGRRFGATVSWVPISAYVDRVLEIVPKRSTAWGSVVFGIEHPDRIQLIDYANARILTSQSPSAARAALAPEFIVWGYTENRGLPADVIARQPLWPDVLAEMFPDVRYRLVSMVVGEPYGTTRVYARDANADAGVMPAIRVFDSREERWTSELGAPALRALRAAPAAIVESLRTSEPRTVTATRTYAVDLPPGDYVVRASIAGGRAAAGAGPRMLVAASAQTIRVADSELAPAGDFAPYGADERNVYLVLRHAGGAAFVSQIGADTREIESVTMFPLHATRSTPGTSPTDYSDRLMKAGFAPAARP